MASAAVCDAACQRQKKLDGLRAALNGKMLTMATDPEGYQKARVAYYTELNGPGWLSDEKERIARDEIEPVVSKYRNQYESLKSDSKNRSVFIDLMNMLNADKTASEEDVQYLNKQVQLTSDKADAINRLNKLNEVRSPTRHSSLLELIVNGALIILGIILAFRILKRFIYPTTPMVIKDRFKSVVYPTTPMIIKGGKRVLNSLIR